MDIIELKNRQKEKIAKEVKLYVDKNKINTFYFDEVNADSEIYTLIIHIENSINRLEIQFDIKNTSGYAMYLYAKNRIIVKISEILPYQQDAFYKYVLNVMFEYNLNEHLEKAKILNKTIKQLKKAMINLIVLESELKENLINELKLIEHKKTK